MEPSRLFGASVRTVRGRGSPPGVEKIALLAQRIRKGEVQAAARAISLFESTTPASQAAAQELLAEIFPYTGGAHLIGITGPPGVGKSSLVDQLVGEHLKRQRTQKVACLLIDPTNQFTGGSVLGDRIRFGQTRVLDKRVFIRSMAAGTRLGGLSHSIREAVAVLEAAGYGLIAIETVGIGQSEIEIVKVAQTVILACQPASGDSIQMLKSGITEIGHVLAINKADLVELAEGMYQTVSSSVSEHRDGWRPIVLKTSTQEGHKQTISALYDAAFSHRAFLERTGLLAQRREEYLRAWVRELVDRGIIDRVKARCPVEDETRAAFAAPITASPHAVATTIIQKAGID